MNSLSCYPLCQQLKSPLFLTSELPPSLYRPLFPPNLPLPLNPKRDPMELLIQGCAKELEEGSENPSTRNTNANRVFYWIKNELPKFEKVSADQMGALHRLCAEASLLKAMSMGPVFNKRKRAWGLERKADFLLRIQALTDWAEHFLQQSGQPLSNYPPPDPLYSRAWTTVLNHLRAKRLICFLQRDFQKARDYLEKEINIFKHQLSSCQYPGYGEAKSAKIRATHIACLQRELGRLNIRIDTSRRAN